MKTLTLIQANSLIARANTLFKRAAIAWESGNNSGDPTVFGRGERRCDKLRREAEALIEPLGIDCDYPGLYPTFSVGGFDYHSLESAVSAVLESESRLAAAYIEMAEMDPGYDAGAVAKVTRRLRAMLRDMEHGLQ